MPMKLACALGRLSGTISELAGGAHAGGARSGGARSGGACAGGACTAVAALALAAELADVMPPPGVGAGGAPPSGVKVGPAASFWCGLYSYR